MLVVFGAIFYFVPNAAPDRAGIQFYSAASQIPVLMLALAFEGRVFRLTRPRVQIERVQPLPLFVLSWMAEIFSALYMWFYLAVALGVLVFGEIQALAA